MEFKSKDEVIDTYKTAAAELERLIKKYGENSNEGQIFNYLLEVELQEQFNHTLSYIEEDFNE